MNQTIFFDSLYSNNIGNPFDTTFNLSSGISQIKSICLKSLEMPISFPNIRDGLNEFIIRYLSTNYSIKLSPTNYTSATTLCNDLTTAFNSSSIPIKPTFSIVGDKIRITMIGTGHLYTVIQTNFSRYICGFSFNQTSNPALGSNSTITADYNYLLNIDNYVSMYFENLPNISNSSNNLRMTYKIPLNAVNGVVYYFGSDGNFNQCIEIKDSNIFISYIRVKILDRFNNIIDNNGCHYSFTLEIITN